MKKHTILLLLLCSTVACNNNSSPIPELKYDGANGDIRMIKESMYYAFERFGEPVADELQGVVITEFDNKGHQIKAGAYDADGDCYYAVERTYENNLLVSEVIRSSNNNKATNRVIERTKSHIKWALNEGTKEESTCDYYYDGLLSTRKDKNGVIENETLYNDRGQVLEERQYSNGTLSGRKEYEYDKDGNMIKETDYVKSDSMVITFTYPESDKKGNWLTRYWWDNDRVLLISIREITYR